MHTETLPPRISALPPWLANQIAAGEVIERPAHLVKELVENSLDAGATRIQCEVYGGGIQRVRVSDNGHGIHPEDLLLAVTANATSKVKSQEDLTQIASLGFRGEALASIGSVAHLSVVSRLKGHEQAYAVHDGVVTPAQRLQGTVVTVDDLFHNVLARRRFLKSAAVETAEIQDMMMRLALSHFDVEWIFQSDGEKKWMLPALPDRARHSDRVGKLWGRRFLADACFFEADQDSLIRVWGWLGGSRVARSDRTRQYLYLNGRMVRDPLLQRILRAAYEPLIPPGRFPMYIVYLTWPLAEVDVNVHPTKHAVRFHDPKALYQYLYGVISEVLGARVAQQQQIDASEEAGGSWPIEAHAMDSTGPLHPSDMGSRYALHVIAGEYYWVDAHAMTSLTAFEAWREDPTATQENSQVFAAFSDEEQTKLKKWALFWESKGFHWDLSEPGFPRLLAYPVVLSSLSAVALRETIGVVLKQPVFPEETFASYFCCALPHQTPDPQDHRILRFLGARCRHGRHAVIHMSLNGIEEALRRGRF